MRSAFLEDIHRCVGIKHELTVVNAVRTVLRDFGLQALAAYRLGRWLLGARGKSWAWPFLPIGWPIYFALSRYVRLAYDIHLRLSADIGPGLYIGHFGGVLLDRCRIGTHCSISQSTRIHPGESASGPILGDRVWIGAHAQIIGAYNIGSGSTISAGAIVTRDIPERTLCMGNPARVVLRGYDNTAILLLS